MSLEEELQMLRQEKTVWQVGKADLPGMLTEVTKALREMSERVKMLDEHQSKDSHNSLYWLLRTSVSRKQRMS